MASVNAQPTQGQHSLPNSLIGRLLHFAEVSPLHDAVVTPSFTLSYSQLAERVITQVTALKNIGISSASIVGINCSDDAQHLVLCLATTYIGATSCTLPSYEGAEAHKTIIEYSGVTHILDGTTALDLASQNGLANLPPTEKPASMACLLFSTSGTTGEPKLVVHHDSDLVEQAHRHIGSKQERFTCRASMEHNFAKRHRLYCLAVGASNVFLSGESEAVVKECRTLKVNVMHVSSFQAQELLNQPNINQLAVIRLKLGGSHVPLSLRTALRANITPYLQAGYGTTETGAIAFTDPDDSDAGESVGRALPGIQIRCVDTLRKPLKQGERGEVAIRCKGLFRGYHGKPELTARRLEKGWFYTGDMAYLDEQQRIHLCGRSDDMFTFNSMNIYPQEIESEIRQFPDVIDAVVLPKPSSVHGNIPIALVVFNQAMRPDLPALRKFVQKRVGVRSPRHYTFVDKIPTNLSGKVSRAEATKLTEKSEPIRQKLINLLDEPLIQNVRPSQIKDFIDGKRDLSFRKLDMDSLARMNLLVSLETNYDIVIAPQELARLRTLGRLASRMLTLPETPVVQQAPDLPHVSFDNVKSAQTSTPYIVRFLQRLCGYCETVAQLNQTFAKLEHRLTPLEVAYLDQAHAEGQLVAHATAEKFQTALSSWLNETKTLMFNSGKKVPEPFVMQRITPKITLFSSQTSSTKKTLLVAFPPRDVRHMMMPNAVLLQHIDAAKYDLLIVTPMDEGGYQFGTLPFGKKLNQQAHWLSQQVWFKPYQHIRTLGFSAGSFPAIALGCLLQAEVALSIAGRFHKKQHFLINLDKIMTMRQTLKKGRCQKVLISYSAHNARDQRFASFFAKACKGKEIAIEIKTERLPHLLLRRLAERGELAAYFAQTLFAKPNNAFFNKNRQKEIISFPLSSKATTDAQL
ncbi:MAG: AMP-binding protein [Methylophilaceae bacterium]